MTLGTRFSSSRLHSLRAVVDAGDQELPADQQEGPLGSSTPEVRTQSKLLLEATTFRVIGYMRSGN